MWRYRRPLMCISQTGACSASQLAGPTSFQFSVLKWQKSWLMRAAGFEPAKLWFHRTCNNHPTRFTFVKLLIFFLFCSSVFLFFSFFWFFSCHFCFSFSFLFLIMWEIFRRFIWTFFQFDELFSKSLKLFSNSMNSFLIRWTFIEFNELFSKSDELFI